MVRSLSDLCLRCIGRNLSRLSAWQLKTYLSFTQKEILLQRMASHGLLTADVLPSVTYFLFSSMVRKVSFCACDEVRGNLEIWKFTYSISTRLLSTLRHSFSCWKTSGGHSASISRQLNLFCLCVVWPPCLAILCYMGGDVGHVVYMCEGGGVSLGEESDGIDREGEIRGNTSNSAHYIQQLPAPNSHSC